MKAYRKRVLGRAATWLIRTWGRALRRRPIEKVYRSGEGFGRLVGKLFKKRKQVAVDNLGLAMPELSLDKRQAIADRTFENFGRAAADFLVGTERSLAELEGSTEILGKEHLEQAVAAGKGTIMITGHLGNWERISSWLSLSGYPLTVIARDADQDDVNQVVNEIRSTPGTSVVARGDSVRAILERLKANEIIGILPDQNSREVFVPFFGKPAGTVLGPGVLNARTGAAVLPVYCVYVGSGRWKIVICPVLEPEPGYETKGEGMMRSINGWLEGVIREYPDQWLWFHDRWRNARKEGLLD